PSATPAPAASHRPRAAGGRHAAGRESHPVAAACCRRAGCGTGSWRACPREAVPMSRDGPPVGPTRPQKSVSGRNGTGGPLVNEVNAMAGFTEHSQLPRMFAAAGLPYPELLDLLVSDALSGQAVAPVTRL